MSRWILRLIPIGLAVLHTGGCRDTAVQAIGAPGDSIWVEQPSFALHVGDAPQVRALVVRRNGHREAGARPRFGSSAPEVASVDSTGRVTARAPGVAVVTASFAGLRTLVPVEVAWGDLAELSLTTPAGGVIRANLWALSPTYVRFTARGTPAGPSVCGQVPLSFQSDSTVAVAVYSPLPGEPCMLRIVPRGVGRTRLTVTGPGKAASADVEVTGQRYWFGVEPENGRSGDPVVAGQTLPYRVLVMDETGRPARGVALRFDGSEGEVRADMPSFTDSTGVVRVLWSLPSAASHAMLRVTNDGREVARFIQPLLVKTTFEREDGEPGEPAVVGRTAHYRLTVLDAAGAPVAGLPVRFEAAASQFPVSSGTAGTGSANPTSSTTDAAGSVRVAWTFPTSLFSFFRGFPGIDEGASLTVRWTRPTGGADIIVERVTLRPERPERVAVFRERFIQRTVFGFCGFQLVDADTIDLHRDALSASVCRASHRLGVAVVDRYGNPVFYRRFGIAPELSPRVEAAAEYPPALHDDGWCECGPVTGMYIQPYLVEAGAQDPWAGGLRVTFTVPGEPAVPQRTVVVVPVVQ